MVKKRILSSISGETLEEPAVNLTPLIDVVFVILIMFIVIAPLLELDHIELAAHSSSSFSPDDTIRATSPILIQVHTDNTILFNNHPISIQELTPLLKEAKQQFPDTTPQILHDKRAAFGTYQLIKNAAEEVGFQNIEIILKPA